jgi:hypothetical protein
MNLLEKIVVYTAAHNIEKRVLSRKYVSSYLPWTLIISAGLLIHSCNYNDRIKKYEQNKPVQFYEKNK